MRQLTALTTSRILWVAIAALMIGFAAGRGWTVPGTTAALLNQATPTAECVPSNTASPEVLASPIAAGQPTRYGEDWTVQVQSATTATAIRDVLPEGLFVVINLTITNNTAEGRTFPFDELILRDDENRPFVADAFPTNLLDASRGFHSNFPPSLPIDTAVVFDVAADVGTTFILDSTADPTFRVQVSTELRGTAIWPAA